MCAALAVTMDYPAQTLNYVRQAPTSRYETRDGYGLCWPCPVLTGWAQGL